MASARQKTATVLRKWMHTTPPCSDALLRPLLVVDITPSWAPIRLQRRRCVTNALPTIPFAFVALIIHWATHASHLCHVYLLLSACQCVNAIPIPTGPRWQGQRGVCVVRWSMHRNKSWAFSFYHFIMLHCCFSYPSLFSNSLNLFSHLVLMLKRLLSIVLGDEYYHGHTLAEMSVHKTRERFKVSRDMASLYLSS